MLRRPRILITAGAEQDTDPYERAVAAAGGEPHVRRPAHPITEYFAVEPHAILLAGGASVSPDRYGSGYEDGVSFDPEPQRDDREFALLASELGGAVPILGICRGMQVLNVSFGGTLWQHLPLHGLADNHAPELERTHLAHEVYASAGRLEALLGRDPVSVNSIHDQAVRVLAPTLQATVHTSDGVIEGVETHDGRVLAVQWHPEELAPFQMHSRRLFEDLVDRTLAVAHDQKEAS